jgi:hypothetical protein
MPIDVFLDQFNEYERTMSLDDLFNFKESKKRLTMDFVGDVLMDHFNECEGTRSLDNIFNFREFEKSLTMYSVGVPFL